MSDLSPSSQHETESHHVLGLGKKTPSFIGFGKVAPAPAGIKNIDKLKQKSSRNLSADIHYKPKVSQTFLQDWLNYPVDRQVNVTYQSFALWAVWLRWTNRAIAGLDPVDSTIRARVCNQLQVLGTAASLFLVIAVASFLVPPVPREEHDHFLVNIFGCLMFTASVSLILYIALALTAIFPLIESLRDDIAFDAFEHYQRRLGGKETYLFFAGMMLVLVSMLVASRILYTDIAVFVMGSITIVICGFVLHLGRLVFLALDPISSMHLGLTNDPEDQYRAELLSHFILRKIPNTLIVDDDTGKEFFAEKRESAKLEHTRASQKLNPKKKRLSVYAENRDDGEDEEDDDIGFGHRGSVDSSTVAGLGGAQQSRDGCAGQQKEERLPLTDFDGTVVPFSAPLSAKVKPKPQQPQSRGALIEAARAEAVARSGMNRHTQLPLQELFCHPEHYVLQDSGLSLVDSAAVYANVTQAGCASTEQLLKFLKEAKQYRPCTCSRDSNADAGSPAHSDQCSSRRAGVWAEALTNIGVPYFHAIQVVQALRSSL